MFAKKKIILHFSELLLLCYVVHPNWKKVQCCAVMYLRCCCSRLFLQVTLDSQWPLASILARGIGGEWGNKQHPPSEKVFLIKMQWNSKHIVPLPPLNPKLKDSTSGKSPKTCWTHLFFSPCASLLRLRAQIFRRCEKRKTKNEKRKIEIEIECCCFNRFKYTYMSPGVGIGMESKF